MFCWRIGVILSGQFRVTAAHFCRVEQDLKMLFTSDDSKEKYVYKQLIDQLIL